MKVIIIGGGWAGCAASITAKKAGAEVHIYEKTDMLLGLGNVGGIMRNNGRFTASEELIAMGAGDLISLADKNATHTNIDFPNHKHATFYNVNTMESLVREYLENKGVNVHTTKRVVDIEKSNNKIKGIYLHDGDFVDGDVFIETTGSTGPMGNCLKYGNGCCMCVLRCPAFGPRVSITKKAGLEDIMCQRENGKFGAFSGSCKLAKESLSEEIRNELNNKGVVILKIPEKDINLDKLNDKVCQQYAFKEFAENIILLDTGHAKLMTPYYDLKKLRNVKGLENVRFVDPYAGSKGNSIRYLSSARRDNSMKVLDIDNLFCAGEKSGFFIGHTEAIATGSIAGHNAVRFLYNMNPVVLPEETAIGNLISYANYMLNVKKDYKTRYTFAGSVYFERMQELGIYSIDKNKIREKIKSFGLEDIFSKKLI